MSLKTRLAKLEHHQKPKGGYVVRIGRPPTPDEVASIMRARAEGRRHAILPHHCDTVDEWLARYGRETLQ
ncbi:hypothetical protein [Bradyrhizobium sp. 23AC]